MTRQLTTVSAAAVHSTLRLCETAACATRAAEVTPHAPRLYASRSGGGIHARAEGYAIAVRSRASTNAPGEQEIKGDEHEISGEEQPDRGTDAVDAVPGRELEVRQGKCCNQERGGHEADPTAHERHDRQQPNEVLRREHLAERDVADDRGRERSDEATSGRGALREPPGRGRNGP